MKILSAKQTKDLDAYTIKKNQMESIDLMECASGKFFHWFIDRINYNKHKKIQIICGRGNNGGDGLAVARMLFSAGYQVNVTILEFGDSSSLDYRTNLYRYQQLEGAGIDFITDSEHVQLSQDDYIIDAIFGSGLNREIDGHNLNLIEKINASNAVVYAIDIPSGLFCDNHTASTAVEANHVLSFELPKLAFMFPENYKSVQDWEIRSIGLDKERIEGTTTKYSYVDKALILDLLRQRNKFDHKGTYGHACIVAGSRGMIGAALLAATACLRTGVGLLSLQIPNCGYNIVQTKLPEALTTKSTGEHCLHEIALIEKADAYGIGPGLGQDSRTRQALAQFLKQASGPLVLDADALNILAKDEELLKLIPENSILTPHVKEFERIFGKTGNDFDRNRLQQMASAKYNIYIILKGAHSCTSSPTGQSYFNSTGNNGMATAGSGDVLTGILTSLLAQGYDSLSASLLGVYLHGSAGDKASSKLGNHSLIASDIVNNIADAFKSLHHG